MSQVTQQKAERAPHPQNNEYHGDKGQLQVSLLQRRLPGFLLTKGQIFVRLKNKIEDSGPLIHMFSGGNLRKLSDSVYLFNINEAQKVEVLTCLNK